MIIYEDANKTIVVNDNLIENHTYQLDFESESESTIQSEIEKSKLSNFIDWQKGNRYGRLTITNYIGNIYFFENTYNVKSPKFLTELSGVEQFKKLLNDIEDLSKNIIFTYNSPSFVLRQVNFEDTNPTVLLIYNYFKKIILDWDSSINLEACINRILKNPNFKYITVLKQDRIEKIRKIDNKTLKLIISNTSSYANVNEENANIINLPITKFISQNSTKKYFPTKSQMKVKYLSYDTPENRFVKYFIRYIASFAYRLNSVKNLPSNVNIEKEKILYFCRRMLNKPFFRDVGEMINVPSNSTVLQGRSGYKDILSHYSRSRFGIKHMFEEFEKEALSIDLKKISDLYEYWVFYKIAVAFLGNDITIEQREVVVKDGNISYGVCFRNESISVFYNESETRAKKSSYSVGLRPDTTVVIKNKGSIFKFIFDAKYKVVYAKDKEKIERHINIDDIHKMHTYLDAIKDSKFAIAIYPGTESYFYEKGSDHPIRQTIDSIEKFEGVGAIPLIPENNEQYNKFQEFVNRIKSQYLD